MILLSQARLHTQISANHKEVNVDTFSLDQLALFVVQSKVLFPEIQVRTCPDCSISAGTMVGSAERRTREYLDRVIRRRPWKLTGCATHLFEERTMAIVTRRMGAEDPDMSTSVFMTVEINHALFHSSSKCPRIQQTVWPSSTPIT